MATILLLGGLGYIGSHVSRLLVEAGHAVVVGDNGSAGHRWALAEGATLEEVDILDAPKLNRVFKKHRIDAVMHFAGKIQVAESVEKPELYYKVNVVGSQNVATACIEHGVSKLVFSSSAAVYGNGQNKPLVESDECNPTSPYGETKLAVEKLLAKHAKKVNSVSLRYFNACGGHPTGEIGELHLPETHLVPNAVMAALGKTELKIYGDDYETKDGSAVRDYVHVMDIATAHILALNYLIQGGNTEVFNIGTGKGCTVLQVAENVRKICGELKTKIEPRRPGDPAFLVADATKIKRNLGWRAKYSRLDNIIKTDLNFRKRCPHLSGLMR